MSDNPDLDAFVAQCAAAVGAYAAARAAWWGAPQSWQGPAPVFILGAPQIFGAQNAPPPALAAEVPMVTASDGGGPMMLAPTTSYDPAANAALLATIAANNATLNAWLAGLPAALGS